MTQETGCESLDIESESSNWICISDRVELGPRNLFLTRFSKWFLCVERFVTVWATALERNWIWITPWRNSRVSIHGSRSISQEEEMLWTKTQSWKLFIDRKFNLCQQPTTCQEAEAKADSLGYKAETNTPL